MHLMRDLFALNAEMLDKPQNFTTF
jgi:hypothetical protein